MSIKPHSDNSELTRLLVTAHQTRTPLPVLQPELIPTDADSAYAVQHRTLNLRKQAISGWKVGAKSTDGPIQCAPLPADRVLRQPAIVHRSDYGALGLELEIAFRLRRVFEPRGEPYSDRAVLGSVGSMLATIEVVSSRFAQWPEVSKLAQLADLQNHGALICAESIPYNDTFPFVTPHMTFRFNSRDIIQGQVGNPAVDLRRLLIWTVNHCIQRDVAIGGDDVITTGSYTGIYFPAGPGTAVGEIDGLAPVSLTII
jgi:2-keto-4-pentenoate hydratase